MRIAIESHWAFNETLQQFDFVLYAVDRHDVETGNVAPLADFIGRIVYNDKLCRKLQGRVELTIDGYNDDPRELWEIPEVTALKECGITSQKPRFGVFDLPQRNMP
jgi:hypothetical protein